jgi:ABC-2 type transport system ATP-binding protein
MMPVLTAHGAGVRHRRRWLFRDVEVSAGPGEMLAVVGPPGSGRTTLLLALARRFRLSAGTVTINGASALGYVPEVSAPEPVLTVGEHVRERLALLGRKRAGPVDLLGLDPQVKGRDLTPYEKQVLGLVLAKLSNPALIALDGLDDGLDATEQESLLKQLAEITADGITVVVTARDIDPALVTTVIRLAGRERAGDEAPIATVTTSVVTADEAPIAMVTTSVVTADEAPIAMVTTSVVTAGAEVSPDPEMPEAPGTSEDTDGGAAEEPPVEDEAVTAETEGER